MLDFLKFENPRDEYGVIKATIHKSGRLGFSSGAQKFMNLSENQRYKVGFNQNDSNDESIYLVGTSKENEQGFKIYKAGAYYYLKLKSVFKNNGIDYKNENTIYDIEKINNGMEYYKLNKRERVSRNNEQKNQSTM
ncbi:MAG: hypothetical protein JXK08_02755 [Flavobacteriaceae bacterium]|nr:hypothetical protein [Flavobacteriaceae bacterium]